MIRLCDESCNECPVIGSHKSIRGHQNNRQLTLILNRVYDQLGDKFYDLINKQCTNLTVCAECRVDDFTHVESCSILEILEEETQSSTPTMKEEK